MMLAMHFLKGLFHEHSRRIYLDHAAATPIRHQVFDAMVPVFKQIHGNPSSIHAEGVAAAALLTAARTGVARTLMVRPEDVVFTSSGTEANNLALLGTIKALHHSGTPMAEMEVITTAIEHPSLTAAMEELRAWGVTVHHAPVSKRGHIDVEALAALVNARTALLATAYVNSEIGVIAPLRKIKKVLAQKSKALLLADAAQAPLWLPCQLEALGVDIMTFDGGKMYGPKGVGAVVYQHGVPREAVQFGGGQERGLRPGTENVPLIVGFEAALLFAQRAHEGRAQGIQEIRDYAITVLTALSGVVLNGDREARVSNNINISIPGYDTEFITVVLDKHGISVSTKSACSGAGGGESTVIMALYNDPARARSTLRLTLGETSSKADIDFTVDILGKHLATMKPFDQSA
jgi:cysteine desulfurase